MFERKFAVSLRALYRCFEIITIVCPSKLCSSILLKIWNSRVYVDHARVAIVPSNSSMTSLCQPWILSLFISRPCDQVLSFSSKMHTTRSFARSFARSHVARTVHARGGQDMRVCGWKCRTAVHPVGRVGWVLENDRIRTSLTRIGCSSCRRTTEYNYFPLALNVVR